jgi:PAS domain S-box-containing protein
VTSRRPRPTLVDRERPFDLEELFISTTDAKGVIRMSNKVFVRVSGYEGDELVGQAHNVVRHPHMPRAVFDLFWEFLGAGRMVAAYVKNLATDGAHYWVMAVAAPVPGGYISVRLKPTSDSFAAVQDIYADVLAVESATEGGDPKRRKAAIAAGRLRLEQRLRDAGFGSYEAFMRAALATEVRARQAALGSDRRGDRGGEAEGRLREIVDACNGAQAYFGELVSDLERYAALSDQLVAKSRFVRELASEIRLFSLNALLASARLADGATLAAVADLMRARSVASGPTIAALGEEIEAAVELLREIGFRISASQLQTEMMGVFVRELVADGTTAAAAEEQLALLAGSLAESVTWVAGALTELETRLRALSRHAVDLQRHLDVFRALEVNGRVEAARASDAGDVRELFRTIGEQVGSARNEMREFSGVDRIGRGGAASGAAAGAHVRRIQAALAA